ncbi:hypothetical protein GS429_20710 [Natronorubrum sp. JWXQ-INN-674]|uniref:Uncharacterized protein n=1 Tax=Natronorubrum halalkaliphilum TaxID=2691917 RepID=A0A6B0VSS1_9EURY|nr:hypothetical protein [Natronorubrum halalkaliphilum]MXV64445.1 hypothetical protein [Natronorubrum halalkaliphilum]
MAQSIDDLQSMIVNELRVLEDDIHVTSDGDTLTFYLPSEDLDKARDELDSDLEVLEEHEYEYLVKVTL